MEIHHVRGSADPQPPYEYKPANQELFNCFSADIQQIIRHFRGEGQKMMAQLQKAVDERPEGERPELSEQIYAFVQSEFDALEGEYPND